MILILTLFVIFAPNIYSREDCSIGKKETKYKLASSFKKSLSVNEYYHLPISQFKQASQYDYFVFKIRSVSKDKNSHQLFVTIQDEQSKNYWSQLNHISEVQDGENLIYVDLKQYVGERGSQKKLRRIDFKKIKKAFIVLDPEKSGPQKVQVSDFYFLSSMRPKYSKDLKVFDFRMKDISSLPCITSIDESEVYSSEKGYGFKSVQFWKKENSQYLDPFLSSVVYIQEGEFLVDLENGVYDLTLFWNSLGYWEPPFFRHRKVLAEDIPLLIEDRSEIVDYENDFLIFENKEPQVHDDPWDWLFYDVMKPISKKVVIKDGKLNLKFSGDASGVGLNGIIISKANNKKEVEEGGLFRNQFKNYLKSLYSRKVRSSYQGRDQWKSSQPIARLLERVAPLDPFIDLSKVNSDVKKVLFSSQASAFVNLILQSPSPGKIGFKWVGENSKLEIIPYKGKFSWVSLDRNHESYTLETQVLKHGELSVDEEKNQQFVLEFKIREPLAEKIYRESGSLLITIKGKNKPVTWNFPMEVAVLNERLPAIDFKVGFIGLNSLRYSYFQSEEKLERRRYWDFKYLKLLSEYGFNSFTGLPTNYESPLGLSFGEVDRFLKGAQDLGFSPPYFTYGGEFLHKFFEDSNLVEIQEEKSRLNQFLMRPEFNSIIFQFSDEAGGYSNFVERDLKRANFLKDNFPSLRLGGFSHWNDSSRGKQVDLNKAMVVPSFSDIGFSGLNWLENKGISWGLYNQAQGSREDPYLTFGRKLWGWSRKSGFSHYLEWHSSAISNLPYFDLDGREADVAVALPGKAGQLNPTIKFFQAAEGLQDFRWLSLVTSKQAIDASKILKIKSKFGFRQVLLKSLK